MVRISTTHPSLLGPFQFFFFFVEQRVTPRGSPRVRRHSQSETLALRATTRK